MTLRKKLLLAVAGAIVIFTVIAYLPGILLDRAVWRSLHEQELLLEGATPLFDTVVAQKLAVGDSVDHAKKVLSDAGLESTVDDQKLYSVCRVGRGAAFDIELQLDSNNKVAKIDIRKVYSGP